MPKAPKIFGRFKVLRGCHSEGGKIYKKGDIVESATDLLKHNDPKEPRFASVDDVVETASADAEKHEGLAEMTFAELKTYAEEGEIDITGLTTKDQLIAKIKESE